MHNLETVTVFFIQLLTKVVYSSYCVRISWFPTKQSTSQGPEQGITSEVSFVCVYSKHYVASISLQKPLS